MQLLCIILKYVIQLTWYLFLGKKLKTNSTILFLLLFQFYRREVFNLKVLRIFVKRMGESESHTRINSRALENLARWTVAHLRHFFPRFSFRQRERMHKHTLPVNKISRSRKKDPRAVYRTSMRYSCYMPRARLLASHARPLPPSGCVPLSCFSLARSHVFLFFSSPLFCSSL